MRIRKEDRIIQNGSKISEELNRIYLEGICIDEYENLLDEYKKLYKRYEKTIKFSDNIENSIIHENESLSDNLDYTIKIARNKLFQNISEHKKTKITLSLEVCNNRLNAKQKDPNISFRNVSYDNKEFYNYILSKNGEELCSNPDKLNQVVIDHYKNFFREEW